MWLISVAAAQQTFTCDPVSVPADARAYYNTDPVAVGEAVWGALSAWTDGTSPGDCAAPSEGAVSCEEASYAAGGALVWWREERFSDGDSYVSESWTVESIEVTAPPDLAWTWASGTLTTYTYRSYYDSIEWLSATTTYAASWSGTFVADYPADRAMTAWEREWEYDRTWGVRAWGWTTEGCAWDVNPGIPGYTEVVVEGAPVVLVVDVLHGCVDHPAWTAWLDDVFWGEVHPITWALSGDDLDGDGWTVTDCDDSNADANLCASDTSRDGVDQDCDGDDAVDRDEDGYASIEDGGTDCDDDDPEIWFHVWGEDVCDGVDSNCDGEDGEDCETGDSAPGETAAPDSDPPVTDTGSIAEDRPGSPPPEGGRGCAGTGLFVGGAVAWLRAVGRRRQPSG